ncbi:MAG: helix-turn-helix transcriptional regulator [Oscillospiraceae bacterium]|nr:helix-turn-helix transcriptional regulator [Oscillospiraceae bacterium]
MSKIETNLLTAQEVADILKVKKSTVYEMIKRGDLSSHKIGKQLRISRREMERLLGTEAETAGKAAVSKEAASSPTPEREKHLMLCGQDALLDIIANRMNALTRMPNIIRSRTSSYFSLFQLYQGAVDIATTHLWDEISGEYNVPFVERILPGIPVIMVRLAGRITGFYVQEGNPKNITGWESLGRDGIRLVNRERGSGARVLLDGKLKTMGIRRFSIPGYDFEQNSSIATASAVARGMGDVGLGVKSAANQMTGIAFLPLQLEWYDMVFCAQSENHAPFQSILEYVSSEDFIKEVSQFKDYDCSQTGRIMMGEKYL